MKLGILRSNRLLICLLSFYSFPLICHADSPWVEVRSPHFSVVTNAGEKRGRDVALRFEQMRAVFTVLIPKANVNSAIPLEIVAFSNTKEFREFAPLWHGKPVELAGLFMRGQDRSFILLDLSVEDPYSVVFHEYAHQLLNAMLTRPMDLWFEEGFAEFFSSIQIKDKEAQVGKIPDMTFIVLRQRGMMSVSSLFRTRHDSSTYNESGDHRTVFYQESRMVVHYLYENQLVPKLNVYLSAVAKGIPLDEALQQAFGMSVEQFDKTMYDYVWNGRYKSFVIQNPPSVSSSGFTTAPITGLDVATLTAEIHVQTDDYREKAAAEFQEILKTNPDNLAANRGLGYARLRQKRFDEAQNYFRKAAQLDSKDAKLHFYSALLMSREGTFEGGAEPEEIVKELEAATSIDPTYAEAYTLLGFAQVRAGNPEQGVAAMEKAVSLKPRDERYRFNLAQLYMSNSSFDKAQAILQELEKSGSAELQPQIQKALQFVQLAKQPHVSVAHRQEKPEDDPEETPAAEDDSDAPKLRRKSPAAQDKEPEKIHKPARYMTATILSVDCSHPPSATITAVAGATTWKLAVPDVQRLVVLKAGKFSCLWEKRKAGMNIVETGSGEGTVYTVELLP